MKELPSLTVLAPAGDTVPMVVFAVFKVTVYVVTGPPTGSKLAMNVLSPVTVMIRSGSVPTTLMPKLDSWVQFTN